MNTQTAERPLAEAFAWFDSIREMVDALRASENPPQGWRTLKSPDQRAVYDWDEQEWDDCEELKEAVETRIHESVLSVEVRSGWHCVGGDDPVPAEYRILLSTGGPAVQLVGELDEHGEPTSAHLEHQDWFKPWTEVPLRDLAATLKGETTEIEAWQQAQETLLTFARQFYFGGEG